MRERLDRPLTSSGRSTERNESGLQTRFVDVVGWTVFVLWALSFILDMTPYDYEVPGPIHAIFSIVATAAFGGQALNKFRNGGK